jgi:uncharacterized protein
MELTGNVSIRQPIQVVWSALNNEEILRQCITGCESLERVDESSLVAKLAVKLGPVRAKFNGKINMSEVVPLQGYTLAFEGSGGAAGFAKGSSKVALQANEGGTLVSYTAQASVGGKLGQVGGRMIDATARAMADDFFKAFTQMLETSLPPADMPADARQAADHSAVHSAMHSPLAGVTTIAPSAAEIAPSQTISDSANLVSLNPTTATGPVRAKPAPANPPLSGAGGDSHKIFWFVAGLISATFLMLIGKFCL